MAEALRLADELDDIHTTHVARNAAAELRRLHAENAALHQANEAFSKRQEWWNEKMFALEQQRDALLEALRTLLSYAFTLEMRLLDADGEHRAMQQARAAIKAVEETK